MILMKKARAALVAMTALVLAALAAAPVAAQTAVQQSSTRLDAATFTAVGTNWNTVNTQSTATITPPAGLSVYITAIYLSACQDATGGASSNVNFTTTGLGSGATASPQFALSQASAASTCTGQPGMINFATPLKSAAPGTNVTVVSPSAATHTGFGVEVFGYFAP